MFISIYSMQRLHNQHQSLDYLVQDPGQKADEFHKFYPEKAGEDGKMQISKYQIQARSQIINWVENQPKETIESFMERVNSAEGIYNKVLLFKIVENTLVVITFLMYIGMSYYLAKIFKKHPKHYDSCFFVGMIGLVIVLICFLFVDHNFLDKLYKGPIKTTSLIIQSVLILFFIFFLSILSSSLFLVVQENNNGHLIIISAIITLLALFGSIIFGLKSYKTCSLPSRFGQNLFIRIVGKSSTKLGLILNIVFFILILGAIEIAYSMLIDYLHYNNDNNWIFMILMAILFGTLCFSQQDTANLAYKNLLINPIDCNVFKLAIVSFKLILMDVIRIFLEILDKLNKAQEKQHSQLNY